MGDERLEEEAVKIARSLLADLSRFIAEDLSSPGLPVLEHKPAEDATAALLDAAISRAKSVNASLQRKIEARQRAKALAVQYAASALDLLLLGVL